MKYIIFISIFFVSFDVIAQSNEKIVKLQCFPPNGTNRILNKPDTNSIHPAHLESYKNDGYFGESWTFVSLKIITTKQGKFLYGDLFSPRGGKYNVKQNGYSGPIFIFYNDWECK